MTFNKRASGILMHISSLPSPYGIGTLGKDAYKFVDFLDDAGQSYWQMLPVGPVGFGDSPYQLLSSFGGNHFFIDLDILAKKNLLNKKDLEKYQPTDTQYVDFQGLRSWRMDVLKEAFDNFDSKDKDFKEFCKKESYWLDDYALFRTIKTLYDNVEWTKWPEELKNRDKSSLEQLSSKYIDQINFWKFLQYEFFDQWNKLKAYAGSKNIELIGDLPIYVAMDSVDVWKDPEYFKLDENLRPRVVAGVPPDHFSKDGQLWGNPIYDWQALEEDDFTWWINRLKHQLSLFNIVRIDHFRGFEACWEVEAGADTAKDGQWVEVPGDELLTTTKKELLDLPLIAEDLGIITEEVLELRDKFNLPGMSILQFAFNPGDDSEYLPHNLQPNTILYSGTHDNETFMGWFTDPNNRQSAKFAQKYFNLDWYEGYNWGIIRGMQTSVANTCIIQCQDLIGLGNEARMNVPGTVDGNWTWRMESADLKDSIVKKLKDITTITSRHKEEG